MQLKIDSRVQRQAILILHVSGALQSSLQAWQSYNNALQVQHTNILGSSSRGLPILLLNRWRSDCTTSLFTVPVSTKWHALMSKHSLSLYSDITHTILSWRNTAHVKNYAWFCWPIHAMKIATVFPHACSMLSWLLLIKTQRSLSQHDTSSSTAFLVNIWLLLTLKDTRHKQISGDLSLQLLRACLVCRDRLVELLTGDKFSWIIITSKEAAAVFLGAWQQAQRPQVHSKLLL